MEDFTRLLKEEEIVTRASDLIEPSATAYPVPGNISFVLSSIK
jgi:hypothetical protein